MNLRDEIGKILNGYRELGTGLPHFIKPLTLNEASSAMMKVFAKRIIEIVEAEEELEGDPPQAVYDALDTDPRKHRQGHQQGTERRRQWIGK